MYVRSYFVACCLFSFFVVLVGQGNVMFLKEKKIHEKDISSLWRKSHILSFIFTLIVNQSSTKVTKTVFFWVRREIAFNIRKKFFSFNKQRNCLDSWFMTERKKKLFNKSTRITESVWTNENKSIELAASTCYFK